MDEAWRNLTMYRRLFPGVVGNSADWEHRAGDANSEGRTAGLPAPHQDNVNNLGESALNTPCWQTKEMEAWPTEGDTETNDCPPPKKEVVYS